MRINKFLPRAVKHRISNIFKYNSKELRGVYPEGDNTVIEFWLDGFNTNMNSAVMHLVAIYDQILHKDPNWHYFYEDHYSLIRCSLKYEQDVKKYLDENNIEYKWPTKLWREGCYVTVQYQEDFKVMFHTFSELIIKMIKKDDGDQLYMAGDRAAHCFHVMAMYLAHYSGSLDRFRASKLDILYWEADQMARLTAGRAYHIGLIAGEKYAAARRNDDLESKDEEEEVS